MRYVVNDVKPGDTLLTQEINRVGILLGKDRDEYVGAGYLTLARTLHVQNRTLNHPLEPDRRLGVCLFVFFEHRHMLL